MVYDVSSTTDYIRQAARARGIDPDIAVRVARSEGLGAGIWQSQLSKRGRREPSYGPFQLLVGGGGTGYPTGMGNDFKARTGLDPSDPANLNATIDFALDHASKNGWGAWYGAAHAGIGKRQGIGGAGGGGGGGGGAASALQSAMAGRSAPGPAGAAGAMAMAPEASSSSTPSGGDMAAPTVNIGIAPKKSTKLQEAVLARLMGGGQDIRHPLELAGNLAQVYALNKSVKEAEAGEAGELQKAMAAAGLDPAFAMVAQLGGDRESLSQAILGQQQQRTAAEQRQQELDWRREGREYDQGRDGVADARWQTQQDYQQTRDAADDARADRTLDIQERRFNADAAGFKTLTPDEVKARGLPVGQYQVGPDNRVYPLKEGSGVTIVNGQDEGEFQKKAAGRMVERFGGIADGGTAASSVLSSLPQMRELLTIAPQGPVQGRLAEMFPGFSTAGDAFGAAVNQIAPSLRIPGSGAQSDRDMDILLGSFPRLRNDPAANTIILDAFETKARINAQRADIANQALRGDITPGDADRRLGELDRTSIIPEGMRQRLGITQAPDTGMTPSAEGRPRATNQQTGEVVEFDGQNWVPVR